MEGAEEPKSNIPSKETVNKLIEKKTEGNLAKRAELLTRAQILRPLLEDPNKFGMTEDHIETVKQFARMAGEKEAAKVSERLSQGTAEQVDLVLFEVAKSMNIPLEQDSQGHYDPRLAPFQLTSLGLRREIDKFREAVLVRQQELMLETKRSDVSLDEAVASQEEYEYDDAYQYTWGKSRLVGTSSFPTESLEKTLQRLGVLPEGLALKDFIAALKKERKWWDRDEHRTGTSGTYDFRKCRHTGLDTNVSGMKVFLYEPQIVFDRPGESGYRFSMIFDNETFREMAKLPSQPSIFYRSQAPAEPQSIPPQGRIASRINHPSLDSLPHE